MFVSGWDQDWNLSPPLAPLITQKPNINKNIITEEKKSEFTLLQIFFNVR